MVGLQVLCLGEGVGRSPGLMSGGTLLCDLSNDAFDVTYNPPCGQTDACESITFPQLRLRAVIISANRVTYFCSGSSGFSESGFHGDEILLIVVW